MNTPQTIIVKHVGNSSLGTAGLIFSILGWPTCGLLCIPGALFSFLGLFSNKQKSHAIAGLIVGFPGVLFFIFWGMSILGLGAVAVTAVSQIEAPKPEVTTMPVPAAPAPEQITETVIVALTPDIGQPPMPTLRPKLARSNPYDLQRTFTDATGQHRIEAKVLAFKQGWVKLLKADGKEIALEITKLSSVDQDWIKANFDESK